MARMAATWAAKASGEPVMAMGPISPTAGQKRRRDRGPISQRTACWAKAPMPRSVATAAHSASSSRRHSWWRQAVQASTSERVRSGARTATIWAMAPPIDAPSTWARSTPAASSTATASLAMTSRS